MLSGKRKGSGWMTAAHHCNEWPTSPEIASHCCLSLGMRSLKQTRTWAFQVCHGLGGCPAHIVEDNPMGDVCGAGVESEVMQELTRPFLQASMHMTHRMPETFHRREFTNACSFVVPGQPHRWFARLFGVHGGSASSQKARSLRQHEAFGFLEAPFDEP